MTLKKKANLAFFPEPKLIKIYKEFENNKNYELAQLFN